MAYLVQRGPRDAEAVGADPKGAKKGAVRTEIRESRMTERGPRARVLVSFTGPLTPDVLERAAARATRPLDPRALIRRARQAGIPVLERSREPEARALLARLRRREPLDATLAAALRRELARLPERPVSEGLAEVSEWIGASAHERGQALRELMDLYGRIAESRPPRRQPDRPRFPRFSSSTGSGGRASTRA